MNNGLNRRKPASGVLISRTGPTIVFVAVCTEGRVPWLVEKGAHELLMESWAEADAWVIGYYLLMPDHLHLFCAPRNLEIPLERWVRLWKRSFTLKAQNVNWKWQAHEWDTRLRRSESYREKWDYIRQNPVRKGLVRNADEWPHQGMLNVLAW
jgi:putative transposase